MWFVQRLLSQSFKCCQGRNSTVRDYFLVFGITGESQLEFTECFAALSASYWLPGLVMLSHVVAYTDGFCVWVCVCVSVGAHVSMGVCVSCGNLWCWCSGTFLLFFETLAGTSPQTSLPDLRAFWGPPISASHLTTSEAVGTATVRSYFRRSWGLLSGCHIWEAGTFLTELFSWSFLYTYK